MSDTADATALVRSVAAERRGRVDLWARFIDCAAARTVAEIGVYRGAFAREILDRCPQVQTYYMIDPWRHLDDWNKPANRDDAVFERFYDEAMEATREHESRRAVLRGRTTEVIDQIPDAGLDFAYVDGDHTLRGITIDLVRVYPKIRDGGWIGGDDFSRTIWQHGDRFEPTLVFPFAVHFAEAVGTRIYGLPERQFLIEKASPGGFEFVDLTGSYSRLDLLSQMPSRAASAAPSPARVAVRRAARRALRHLGR